MLRTTSTFDRGHMRRYWSTADMPKILTPISMDGLLFWSKNNNPGIGTTWIDASPNGNDGTLYNTTWVDGNIVLVIQDGSYIDYGDIGNPGLSDFSYLIRFKSTGSAFSLLSKSLYGSASNRFFLQHTGTGIAAFFFTTYSLQTPEVTGLNDGKWHTAIVSCVRNGNMNLYIDGILESYIDISTEVDVNFTSPFHLLSGRYNNDSDGLGPLAGTTQAMSGGISDIAMWMSATTIEQADALSETLSAG